MGLRDYKCGTHSVRQSASKLKIRRKPKRQQGTNTERPPVLLVHFLRGGFSRSTTAIAEREEEEEEEIRREEEEEAASFQRSSSGVAPKDKKVLKKGSIFGTGKLRCRSQERWKWGAGRRRRGDAVHFGGLGATRTPFLSSLDLFLRSGDRGIVRRAQA